MLELPRGGKIRAQDAAVERARGEIVAFSDANALLGARRAAPAGRAVRRPARRLRLRAGHASSTSGGTNQEGVYWRYEMALRALESRLRSVTGGNGAIYATRREAYLVVDPIMGHDLSFPFNMVKRGWRAVYAPDARASEKMVPTIEGEFARKRRMMSHGWPIVLRGGMLSPRGYDPLYALMIFSHRVLRYAIAVPAPDRARRRTSRCSASGWRLRRRARAAGGVLLAAARSRRWLPRAAAADRALLRADDRVARRRAVGLAAPRHARPAGSPPEGTR